MSASPPAASESDRLADQDDVGPTGQFLVDLEDLPDGAVLPVGGNGASVLELQAVLERSPSSPEPSRAASRPSTTSTLNPCSSSATTVESSASWSGNVVKLSDVGLVLNGRPPLERNMGCGVLHRR